MSGLWLPEQASEVAPKIDWLIYMLTYLSAFFTVAIVGAMLYFAVKYRKRNGQDHETPRILGSHTLEVIWTVVPILICIYVGYYGIVYYKELRHVPNDPNLVTINVRGQMWNWEFEYLRPDATVKQTKGDAVIPVDRPVKFVLTSRDVLHSFFVPSMRVKSDAIPGHFTYVTFKPVKTGDYQIFCTEYCGQEHWNMLAKLKVVPEAEYSRWLNDRSDELAEAKLSPVELGKQIYAQKGCNACHSLNGSRLVGPSFLKIFGREGTYTDGKAYVADENYLRESILQPNKHIVASYPPNLMPVFEGQLNDRQIEALISWMRTLNGEAPAAAETKPAVDDAAMLAKLSPAERGKHWYETKICVTCHSLDGSKLVGPSFQGIYGRTAKLEGGTEVPSDDAYITESILNPMAKVAAGYAPAMPPYAGQLDEAQIADIIAFMKTVK